MAAVNLLECCLGALTGHLFLQILVKGADLVPQYTSSDGLSFQHLMCCYALLILHCTNRVSYSFTSPWTHTHTHTHTLSLSLLTNFLRDCITSSMSSSTSWWDSTDLHLTIASEMRRKGGGGDGSVCGHSVRLYPNLPSSCSFSMVVFTSVLISTTVAELLP